MSVINLYEQNIALDVNANQAYTVVNAKQGDQNTRALNITFTQDGVKRTLTSGSTLVFRLRKPDGTAVILQSSDSNPLVTRKSDDTVQVILSGQCLAAAGRGYADVLETTGDDDSRQVISAASFVLNIMSQPNIINIKSDSEYINLFDAVEKAVNSAGIAANSAEIARNSAGIARNSAGIAIDRALDAEAWAVGTENGIAVPSTDSRYHNNSKYWASVASTTVSGMAPLESPSFTGTPTAPTPVDGTNNSRIATTAFVHNTLKYLDAMIFKGTIGINGTITSLPNPHEAGWTYKVITAGTYAGKKAEIGDLIICIKDRSTASDEDWTIVQSNIDGAVTGPSSAINNNIVLFDGTSGTIVKDGGYSIASALSTNAFEIPTNSVVSNMRPLILNYDDLSAEELYIQIDSNYNNPVRDIFIKYTNNNGDKRYLQFVEREVGVYSVDYRFGSVVTSLSAYDGALSNTYIISAVIELYAQTSTSRTYRKKINEYKIPTPTQSSAYPRLLKGYKDGTTKAPVYSWMGIGVEAMSSSSNQIPTSYAITEFVNDKTRQLYITAGASDSADIGEYATVEGSQNKATGTTAHAEGSNNIASGNYSHTEGYYTTASGTTAHAEGQNTKATGNYSHAEGEGTKATGEDSHAEGYGTIASGAQAHAEGFVTKATGDGSHAEGYGTIASGVAAHAEGYHTTASGLTAHAEGESTEATGNHSHAEGVGTIAKNKAQHTFGEYNIGDPSIAAFTSRGNYVEIVGNGTSASRSNARTLDWNGNEVLAGKLTVGSNPTNNMDVTTKQYVDTLSQQQLAEVYNAYPHDSVENVPVASFTDGADNIPVKALTVNVTPVQAGSGDPSPVNQRPISGWTGAQITVVGINVWDEVTEIGGISSDTGQNSTSANRLRTKNYIPIKGGETYYFSSPNSINGRMYDADQSYIGVLDISANSAVTIPSGAAYLRFVLASGYGTTYNHDVSVNYPATNTSYHAFFGTTINLPFPTPPGTVCGGTLRDNGDGTWTLTLTIPIVDLGALTWEKSTSTNGGWYSFDLTDYRFASDMYFLCSCYKPDGVGYSTNTYGNDGTIRYFYHAGDTPRAVYIRDIEKAAYTAEEFQAALSGQKMAYELAEPIEYILTAESVKTLLGQNNIFADCGDVAALTYRADPTLYIAKKLAEAANA